jgi:hypothetical protein
VSPDGAAAPVAPDDEAGCAQNPGRVRALAGRMISQRWIPSDLTSFCSRRGDSKKA